jgi:hypothetical protein
MCKSCKTCEFEEICEGAVVGVACGGYKPKKDVADKEER